MKTSISLIKNSINTIIDSNTIHTFKKRYKKLKEKIKKNLVQIKPNRKFQRLTKEKNTKYHLNGKLKNLT
jgi:hypothetical protein